MHRERTHTPEMPVSSTLASIGLRVSDWFERWFPDAFALALAAVAAIHDAGLSVPGDISVAGKDGMPVVAFTRPSLTTIKEPGPEAGVAAFEVLHRLMLDKNAVVTPPQFEAELVVRQSTGPCRK